MFHNDEDDILTSFRKNIEGHGSVEDLKNVYSYSNDTDVDEIFDIIESTIFNSLVAQKMNEYEYEDVVDEELNQKINSLTTFIKSVEGLSFQDGQLIIDGITKQMVIKKYIELFSKSSDSD